MPKRKRPPVPTFQYARLPSSRSFRVLSLKPSPGFSDPLNSSLVEAALDDFPSDEHEYEALSYVWGASTGSVPFTCDDRQLLITPNCDAALRHLRLPNEHRNIWVDAICIDQGRSPESFAERSIQITLMGEVYRNAQRTLCWLGNSEEYTAGTFERLRQIGGCPSKRELRKLLMFDEQLRQKGILEIGSTCLNHIFCNSWHSRIWTLQEVAFSGDCHIVCGKETIPWDLYFNAARFLVFEEFIDELDAQSWKNYVSIGIRDELRNFLHTAPSKEGGERTIELLTSALTQVRHLRATDPKDKVYGLHAAFTALHIPLPDPDYRKSLETIYEEACLAIIRHSGSLQMLGYASSKARAQTLPSWVADWQDEDVKLFLPPAHATEGSRTSQPSLSPLSPAVGQLLVRGKSIGLVKSRSKNDFATLEFPSDSLPILRKEHYDFVGTEIDSLRLLVHSLRQFREWSRITDQISASQLPEDAGDLFHDLITFESLSSDARLFDVWTDILSYPDTSFDLSSGENIAEMWKSSDQACIHHWSTELFQCAVIAAAMLTKSASKGGQVLPEATHLLEYTAKIAGDMGDRALILVHDYVVGATLAGTAFHTVKVDDSIVLLEGAEYPMLLRQAGNKWSFVGPAFVFGIMDGEAWSDENGVVENLEDFVLI